MTPYKIGVIVGSLRKASWSRKLAHALKALTPATLELTIIEIGMLSLFNQDDEANPPQAWINFKQEIKAVDGLLFITPEYNRSIPGCLKNAIDVASRPYGQSAWNKKPGAVISISIGAQGGFGAQHQLRQSFVFLNVPCMQQPEAYIGHIDSLLDDNNNFTQESTKDFLKNFMDAFANWVIKHHAN